MVWRRNPPLQVSRPPRMTIDQWQQWMDHRQRYQDIIPLRLSGASSEEISRKTGISEHSVRTVIDSLLRTDANGGKFNGR